MGENDPDAVVEVSNSPAARQVEVTAAKTVDVWFIDILNTFPGFDVVPDVTVRARAVAGFGLQPVDVHLAIDATGRMGSSPCNGSQSNSNCPIKEAKDAPLAFIDTLMSDNSAASVTQAGVAAFRGCYDPPRSYGDCIDEGVMTLDLTTDKDALEETIDDIFAEGGTGTNICWGLLRAQEDLFGPNGQIAANTVKIVVILSDGDNTYNDNAYSSSQGSPKEDCRPWVRPDRSDHYVGSSCQSVHGSYSLSDGHGRERQLDILSYDKAQEMEAQGVEIYVVGLGVCGSSNSNLCDAATIGNTGDDDSADRNLDKCIATSTAGINDHYFEVDSADELPDVFESIAQQIGFRLIE